MANPCPILPAPNPDHRRVAAGQFERANQVVSTGNFDYGIRLLLSCCKLDPANLLYRQALRRTEKAKYANNLRGSWHAWLTGWPAKARVKASLSARDYLKVLEHGERVLTRNPWDVGVQMDMAAAADTLGLVDLAVWTLEQARQKTAKDTSLNRALARLYEKRGNLSQAMALWLIVRRDHPADAEAAQKLKDLAANDTIARGGYEEAVGPEAEGRPRGVRREPAAEFDSAAILGQEDAHRSSPDHRISREVAALRTRQAADPSSIHPYLQLAAVYRRSGFLEQAREVLNEGLKPTDNAFELTLELTDLEIEPFRQNLVLTEEKLKEQPEDEALRRVRIRLRKEVNTRELEYFRQKSERFPTEMVHRFEVGVRLLRAGQYDEAIQELQAARSDPRHRWQAMLYLGHCFKARNNGRLAQRNFEDALENLPGTESATRKELLFLLAQGHAEAGDLARAVDVAHDLANLDFSYRDIGRLLDEWQSKLQQERIPH